MWLVLNFNVVDVLMESMLTRESRYILTGRWDVCVNLAVFEISQLDCGDRAEEATVRYAWVKS